MISLTRSLPSLISRSAAGLGLVLAFAAPPAGAASLHVSVGGFVDAGFGMVPYAGVDDAVPSPGGTTAVWAESGADDDSLSGDLDVVYDNAGMAYSQAGAELGILHVHASSHASSFESPLFPLGPDPHGDGTTSAARAVAQAEASFLDSITLVGPYAPGTPVTVTAWLLLQASVISIPGPTCAGPGAYKPARANASVYVFGASTPLAASATNCATDVLVDSASFDVAIGEEYTIEASLSAFAEALALSDEYDLNESSATANAANSSYVFFTFGLPGVSAFSPAGGSYEPPPFFQVPAPPVAALLAPALAALGVRRGPRPRAHRLQATLRGDSR
jgi:hypothetical protein